MTYPGDLVALEPMSLTVDDGEVTVILGRSGAGKSTLLRVMNLLIRPDSGQVWSRELGALDSAVACREHRRRSAMVFQQHQLIGRYSALDNTLAGCLGRRPLMSGYRSEDFDLALACLDRVGLLDKALTRADRLSGGQQQRVGIARALMQTPQMILADEPVASLDPATARKVLGLMRDISNEKKIALVISLHQLDLALECADRIIGLADGLMVFDGPPAALDESALVRIYGDGFASQPAPVGQGNWEEWIW